MWEISLRPSSEWLRKTPHRSLVIGCQKLIFFVLNWNRLRKQPLKLIITFLEYLDHVIGLWLIDKCYHIALQSTEFLNGYHVSPLSVIFSCHFKIFPLFKNKLVCELHTNQQLGTPLELRVVKVSQSDTLILHVLLSHPTNFQNNCT